MTESKRKGNRTYAIKNYTSPVNRRRGIRNMDASLLAKLDNLLLTTEIPISSLAIRFNLRPEQIREHMQNTLGYRCGPLNREYDTQARIKIIPDSQ